MKDPHQQRGAGDRAAGGQAGWQWIHRRPVPASATDPPSSPHPGADYAAGQLDSRLGVGVPAAGLFVAVIAWVVTGPALRPVDQIRARLAQVSTRRPGEREPVPRGPATSSPGWPSP